MSFKIEKKIGTAVLPKVDNIKIHGIFTYYDIAWRY